MSTPVLFVGHPGDLTFRYTCNRARECGLSVDVLDLNAFTRDGDITFDASTLSCQVSIPNAKPINLFTYSSCYCRLVDTSAYLETSVEKRRGRARFSALASLVDQLPYTVINRPFHDGGNFSKPYQLWLLEEAGFRIPRSVCTNDYETAKRFCESVNWRAVYKSSSGQRSIVARISDTRLYDLRQDFAAPVLFQELIEGHDLRVHVVGDECHAEKIESSVVDYRYPKGTTNTFSSATISAQLADLCREFCRMAGLAMMGFDFKCDAATGEHFCLEANPSPGYNGFDERANGAISRSLLRLLAPLRGELVDPSVATG